MNVLLAIFAAAIALASASPLNRAPSAPPANSCGLNQNWNSGAAQPFIVGGVTVTPNDYPYQVTLQRGSSHTCGGSIINKRWIVSAAHCFSSTSTSLWRIVVGKHNLRSTDATEKAYSVAKIIKHPQYSASLSNKNDIALLQTTTDIVFNQYVQPVCIAAKDIGDLVGKDSTAIGWGATREGGSMASQLQKVTVPVITNSKCQTQYSRETIYESTICASIDKGGKDACQGDSGGPLVVKSENGSDILVGITSWGYGCARAGYPGVYTRVSSFWDWIWSNAK